MNFGREYRVRGHPVLLPEFQSRKCALQQPEVRRSESSLLTLRGQALILDASTENSLILHLSPRFRVHFALERPGWADAHSNYPTPLPNCWGR